MMLKVCKKNLINVWMTGTYILLCYIYVQLFTEWNVYKVDLQGY